MNIIVRLNISKNIGTGHFRRMLNLSRLKTNYNFTFIIKTDDEENKLFDNLNVNFISREKTFRNYLINEKYDLVIIDLLKYSKNYIKKIKKIIQVPLVTFHEYYDFSEYSDLSINYNFINEKKILINKEKCLLGTKYIIFPKEIKDNYSKIKDNYIFVSFGGSDPSKLTQNFIKRIAEKNPKIRFKIHIGNFNNLEYSNSFKNIEYIYRPNNLFEYMAKAKLAITAGGNIMYELIYFEIPTIVISHNQHQNIFAKNASKEKLICYFGLAKNLNYKKLNKYIKKNKFDFIKEKKKIDDKGKDRIFNSIEKIVK